MFKSMYFKFLKKTAPLFGAAFITAMLLGAQISAVPIISPFKV